MWPGSDYPLGASFDGAGTNFSIFSEIAERVELCLFDEQGNETRYDLPEVTSFYWHGYLPNLGPGQRYGFRVHGPWKPEEGHRCNPAKLLLDPYARAIEGQVQWHEAVFPIFSPIPTVRPMTLREQNPGPGPRHRSESHGGQLGKSEVDGRP